jgi:DNA-binding HxlR family transcriptional regulator
MICQVSAPDQHANLGRLIGLVHHRWNILVIAELHRLSGAKFVTLVNHLDVSRGSLSTSLENLIELGFVRKNTGHGHPMRPEYLLTAHGAAIGADCLELVQLARRNDAIDLAFRKWTLPLLVAIGERKSRFNELRSTLHDATPRAIALGLKALLQEGWVTRTLIDDFPPTAAYDLRPKGRQILACMDSLYGAA